MENTHVRTFIRDRHAIRAARLPVPSRLGTLVVGGGIYTVFAAILRLAG